MNVNWLTSWSSQHITAADFQRKRKGAAGDETSDGSTQYALVTTSRSLFEDALRRLRTGYASDRSAPALESLGAFGVVVIRISEAGQAMNRYRGTQAEFQFSMVLPHTSHSKLLISRASAMCSLRS
jgi:hypothetical protein